MSTVERYVDYVIADFDIGDRGCYMALNPARFVFGTVVEADEDQLVFLMDDGGYITVTVAGDLKGSGKNVISQWHSVPDLSKITVGTVLSRLFPVDFVENERVYGTVTEIIPNQKIILSIVSQEYKFTDDVMVLEADDLYWITLESKLLQWEIEE